MGLHILNKPIEKRITFSQNYNKYIFCLLPLKILHKLFWKKTCLPSTVWGFQNMLKGVRQEKKDSLQKELCQSCWATLVGIREMLSMDVLRQRQTSQHGPGGDETGIH